MRGGVGLNLMPTSRAESKIEFSIISNETFQSRMGWQCCQCGSRNNAMESSLCQSCRHYVCYRCLSVLVDDTPIFQVEKCTQGLKSGKRERQSFTHKYQVHQATKQDEATLLMQQDNEISIHEEGIFHRIFADKVCSLLQKNSTQPQRV